MSRSLSGWMVWIVLLLSTGAAQPQAVSQKPSNPPASSTRELLDRYCVTCHNEKLKTANLLLDKMNVGNVSEAEPSWEKVVRKLRAGLMPPAGLPRPDSAAYESLAGYLETALDRAALAKPNPGRPTIHRLNRTEYANAIRDLLDLEIDEKNLLPEDDSGYGFDNNGDVLSVSPLLLDRYMSAARLVSRLAIGDVTLRLPISTYDVRKLTFQNDQDSEDLPFGSRGGIAIRHRFPVDGEYVLRIRLQYMDKEGIRNLTEPHQLDVLLDGARVKRFTIGGRPGEETRDDLNPAVNTDAGLELRFAAKAGTRLVGVTFRDERSLSEGMLRPPFAQLQLDGQGPKIDSMSDPGVSNVSIAGPLQAQGVGDTPSRRKIFVCRPGGAKEENVCAKKILSVLARRAYRRSVTDSDVQRFMGLYQSGSSGGFEAGISRALQGILLSREFLFRSESDAADATHRVSDLELASRLSFFLWSTIPDDQLLDLAEAGKLKTPAVLEQQVRRMLADPRSKALVSNFLGQWLNLRTLEAAVPEPGVFPGFDDDLRRGLVGEIELFLDDSLRQDHNVLRLLDADYTFVNERVARHYGIPNIYGSRFRRVALADENRWGLLGKGAIEWATSFPSRTSPVTRGKWVLENILGSPPPPPPPNVPALDAPAYGPDRMTMRQRMEQHRANPACASCHKQMDPIGFALENFDGIGQWRSAVAGKPIDVSGELPNGSKFQGPAELRKLLLNRPEQFLTVCNERLLTYALGRGVEYYDQPTIRGILREAASNDYRWSAFILGVVKSVPFQMKAPAERTSTASLR